MPPALTAASRADRLPLAAQEFPVEGRDLLDRPPPRVVVGNPLLGTTDQGGGQRDLLGAAPCERDAEIDGGVTVARGAATPGLATAQAAADDAAAKDLFEGRQLFQQPASAFEQSFHLTAL